MDDSVLASLRGFNGVWGRVTGGEGAPGCTAEDLQRLMCGAACLEDSLRALACRCKSAAPRLNRLADGQAGIVRRLRAEIYLLTGQTCAPGASCAFIPCTLTALRAAYIAAGESAADFAASARNAPKDTARLLDKFSAAQRCTERELKELILRAMDAFST